MTCPPVAARSGGAESGAVAVDIAKDPGEDQVEVGWVEIAWKDRRDLREGKEEPGSHGRTTSTNSVLPSDVDFRLYPLLPLDSKLCSSVPVCGGGSREDLEGALQREPGAPSPGRCLLCLDREQLPT